jgi:hypothetical protein
MKKMFFALMMMLTATVSANAMSYEQARNEALFLTDKMAYELNLTDEQYEACYEINLDYLMGVTGRDDVFGTYWERRNLDLSYILLDWQWNAFIAATYFYRPLYWDAGYWHFGIYARYPYRDYFYFGRPLFFDTYRGAHAWHRVGGRGYYHGHSNHFRAPHREHFGMHDRWNRGDFRGNRHSSTRVTGPRDSHGMDRGRGMDHGRGMDRGNRSIERNNRTIERGNRNIERNNRTIERQNRTIERNNRTIERNNRTIERGNRTIERNNNRSSFGNSSSRPSSPRSSSFSSSRSSSSHSSGSFSGGPRGGGSHSGGSFSGGSRGGGSHSGGSFSGGSRGGGSHSGGGGHGHGGGRR